MNEDTDRSQRREALDQFAQEANQPTDQQLVPIVPAGMPSQVYGAQNVAVKRDERQVLNKIRTLAAAAAGDWFYRFPVRNRKKGSTDYIEGPSVKMANDLARIYGNCDVDCRVMDVGSHLIFTARFIDLETGYSLTRPFQQRKGASSMGSDSDRQADITFQIGASKAIRNVICNALQTYADYAMDEARSALVERIGSDVEKWRQRTVERLKERVDPHRAEAVIGRPWKEWTAPDVAKVITMMKAISDGMATMDETFPPLGADHAAAEGAGTAKLDEFVSSGTGSPGPAEQGGEYPPTAEQGESVKNDPPGAGSPSHDYRPEVVEKALTMVTRYGKTEQQHLDELDALEPMLKASIPDQPEFVEAVMRTAADVAMKRTPVDDARKYLRGMIK